MDNSTIQRVKQRYGIVGNCEALNRAIEIALKIAPVDLSVLITGEMVWERKCFRVLFMSIAYVRIKSILR